MDRTIAISRLNTEEIINEVNCVIKKGLDKLLGDHLYRYELLEKTHDAIMNLPSVRNHLNLQPVLQSEVKPQSNYETKDNNHMIEKLLIRIDELTKEVNQLKKIRSESVTEEDIVVVKLEQKENIKLEIEDVIFASSSEAEELSEAEEEEEEAEEAEAEDEVESVASSIELEEEEVEEEEEEENISSECESKVNLKEDIVDGKKQCDPSAVANSSVAEEEEEEEVSETDEVETEKSDSEEEEASVASSIEVEEEQEAEEEYIEIDIDDVTYCTNNEEKGFIYELTEDGEVGDKVGYLKDGEPFFYADEK